MSKKSRMTPTELAECIMSFLKQKGESRKIMSIVRKMEKLHSLKRGVVDVSVTTAFPVSDALLREIEPFAKRVFEHDVNITSVTTDRRLLGGIVLQTENQLMDVSLARNIRTLKKMLAQ